MVGAVKHDVERALDHLCGGGWDGEHGRSSLGQPRSVSRFLGLVTSSGISSRSLFPTAKACVSNETREHTKGRRRGEVKKATVGATAAARHPELVERDALRLEEAEVRLWVLLRAQVHHLRAAELTKWQVQSG